MTNFYCPLRTLRFEFFLSKLDTRHIPGPILVIFEICHFLMIPGPFEYFSENGCSQKISFVDEGVTITPLSV